MYIFSASLWEKVLLCARLEKSLVCSPRCELEWIVVGLVYLNRPGEV